jgi:hypothetical protein
VLIAFGFMGLSMAISWRYGASLGHNSIDQWMFSATGLLADIAKAATSYFVFSAHAKRKWMPAAVAAGFWLICTLYSLQCFAGFMKANRAMATARLAIQQETGQALRIDLARKQSEREALGSTPPPTIIAERIEQLKRDRR